MAALCGFGFVAFEDSQTMEDAIKDMNNQELDGRVISVNKALPKIGGEDLDYGYSRDHMSSGRGSYKREWTSKGSDCFNCGRSGRFAQECPSFDGVGHGGGSFSSYSGFGGSGGHFAVDRYDNHFYGGRYEDREHMDNRDTSHWALDHYHDDSYQLAIDT